MGIYTCHQVTLLGSRSKGESGREDLQTEVCPLLTKYLKHKIDKIAFFFKSIEPFRNHPMVFKVGIVSQLENQQLGLGCDM
jgi:hypothetical protein